MIEYKIIVPSRKRSENVGPLMEVLGEDLIFFVNQAEEGAYRKAGAARVETHSGLVGMQAIRNSILDRFLGEYDIVVMSDDDLKGVISFTREDEKRVYDSPADVRRIVENMVRLVWDSGAPLGGWATTWNPLIYVPHWPIGLGGPAMGMIVCNQNAPRSKVGNLQSGEDVDLNLEALLSGRIVIIDNRFHFDYGGVWVGKGGLQGKREARTEKAAREFLKEKWQGYIRVEEETEDGVPGVHIKVNRKNNRAITG